MGERNDIVCAGLRMDLRNCQMILMLVYILPSHALAMMTETSEAVDRACWLRLARAK